jgi:hypothetical protein
LADHHKASFTDLAEHEATYKGFLTLLKISAGASAVSLLLMFFFLAR